MKTIQAFRVLTLAGALVIACAAPAAEDSKQPAMSKEQKAMMDAMQRASEVRPEHKQLQAFVGDWNVTTSMFMDPKAPPQKSEGKAHNEIIFDGRYLKVNFQGMYEGQPFNGEGYMGFDNTSGKFFNTWIDSMSTNFSLTWGSYDAATKSYTFRSEMDNPMKPGTKFPVRSVIHVVDPTHYTFDWYETHGGKEAKTMQIDYSKH